MSLLACSSGSSAGTGIHRDRLRLTQRSRSRDATGSGQGGCGKLKPSGLIRPSRLRVLFHLSKNWISAKYGSRTLRRCIRVACSATFAKHWPPWDLACPLGDAKPPSDPSSRNAWGWPGPGSLHGCFTANPCPRRHSHRNARGDVAFDMISLSTTGSALNRSRL